MTRRFFTYSTGFVALAGVVGANAQFTININNQYNFEVAYLTGAVDQAGLLVTNWSGLVQINDSGVGANWFDQVAGVPFMSVVGDGRQPYPIGYPRLVGGNTNQVVTFTNRIATATNVCLVLNGYMQIPD